jgi:hypothetical protein
MAINPDFANDAVILGLVGIPPRHQQLLTGIPQQANQIMQPDSKPHADRILGAGACGE